MGGDEVEGPVAVEDAELRRRVLSCLSLVVGNCVPLIGAVFFGWSVLAIMLVFWMENVVIGVFNLLRMAVAPAEGLFGNIFRVMLMVFFAFHYGMFAFVHGIFVLALFSNVFKEDPTGGAGTATVGMMLDLLRRELPAGMGVALLGLVASHGISYGANYIRGGEYRTTTLDSLMMRPYGRVVVLHLALIGSAFIMVAFGGGAWALGLLVVLKTGLDLHAHLRERRVFAAQARAASRTVPPGGVGPAAPAAPQG